MLKFLFKVLEMIVGKKFHKLTLRWNYTWTKSSYIIVEQVLDQSEALEMIKYVGQFAKKSLKNSKCCK